MKAKKHFSHYLFDLFINARGIAKYTSDDGMVTLELERIYTHQVVKTIVLSPEEYSRLFDIADEYGGSNRADCLTKMIDIAF